MTLGRRQLEQIRTGLIERDTDILTSLMVSRYLSTAQIRRLHFYDHASGVASARATNRALSKLKNLQLIAALKRRIGGVRAGSASYIWMITEAGVRLLHLMNPERYAPTRHRVSEPTEAFVAHALMVAEIWLTGIEAAREGIISIMNVEHEPVCWREFVSRDGARSICKPDLFLTTTDGEFEDRWFIEADRESEPLSRIDRTCRRYQEYCDSGREQKASGVFPAVVWVVPRAIRREAIEGRIRAEKDLKSQLFRVVTLQDFKGLMLSGAGV